MICWHPCRLEGHRLEALCCCVTSQLGGTLRRCWCWSTRPRSCRASRCCWSRRWRCRSAAPLPPPRPPRRPRPRHPLPQRRLPLTLPPLPVLGSRLHRRPAPVRAADRQRTVRDHCLTCVVHADSGCLAAPHASAALAVWVVSDQHFGWWLLRRPHSRPSGRAAPGAAAGDGNCAVAGPRAAALRWVVRC